MFVCLMTKTEPLKRPQLYSFEFIKKCDFSVMVKIVSINRTFDLRHYGLFCCDKVYELFHK